ncbi:hypothetical protein [Thalassoroseus pseudoceratinae]|uniref:hypothetical protein n=1 Tax=Thalassoroseus pseudoceratinae TaxID=2713176 RepID=UPI0014223C88|nr:hypothetical protein [Thalassoroseus pseudoceratinae]
MTTFQQSDLTVRKSHQLKWLMIIVGLVTFAAGCHGQDELNETDSTVIDQRTVQSVVRYAVDDFTVGCRVQPKPLSGDQYFGTLPILNKLPGPISWGRLSEMNVEELAIFGGPESGERTGDRWSHGVEWAAAARLSRPVELKSLIRQWRKSLVPREVPDDPQPEPMSLDGVDGFRIPAGSFFPPPRIYSPIRFTDSDGQPVPFGVNVGNIDEYRSYIACGTKASAIFTLDGIDESLLIDDELPLELRFHVFLTSRLPQEFPIANIELRNPKTGLRSEPLSIQAQSFVNRRLNFPRRLTVIAAKGRRQADLLRDLVSEGRLEVVLTGTHYGTYYGVGEFDLNVFVPAFEYVAIDNRELVVAQTPETLQTMLQNEKKKPTELARRLSQPGDIVVSGMGQRKPDRLVLGNIFQMLNDGPIWYKLATLNEFTGAVRLDRERTVEISAKFTREATAQSVGQRLGAELRKLQVQTQDAIEDHINRVTVKAQLATLGMDGVPFAIPYEGHPVTHEEKTRERTAAFLNVIDDIFDGIQTETEKNRLLIQFTVPKSLSNLSKSNEIVWAKLDLGLAGDLFNFEKFDRGDEALQRATNRIPHVTGAWFWRAWQLAYNTPSRMNGYWARYVWIRRGINSLLDGAEQNPNTIDLQWMAARLISRKIGEAGDREAFREFFSEDQELHQRLARWIDLDQAKSPSQQVDNFLVAKLLFEYCIERLKNKDVTTIVWRPLIYSRPASTQARYADSLTRNGHWDAAADAWKEAEILHEDFSELQWANRNDRSENSMDFIHRTLRLDFWLMRCRFEQTDEIQTIRKLWYQADELARQSKWEQAIQFYSQSLQKLAEFRGHHPNEYALLAGDFRDVAFGYKAAKEQQGESEDKSSEAILSSLKSSESYSTYSIMIDPERIRNYRNQD